MKKVLGLSLLFIAINSYAFSPMHEHDLTGERMSRVKSVAAKLTPTRVEVINSRSGQTEIEIIGLKNGEELKLKDLPFNLPTRCAAGKQTTLTAKLKNQYFDIKGGWRTYEIEAPISCLKKNRLLFNSESDAGQAVMIYDVAQTAVDKFQRINRLDFWQRTLKINWPGNGDYYSFGTVNLTRGDHWDVVGHEIGHGIYDFADIGAFGGGSHRIDECYSEALALSEGWASFFVAWLKVDLNDSDAKFEFLVPRRAPIRFENIPPDVCQGQTNEWRVTGFLWDLIDLNKDAEEANLLFQTLWDITLNKNFSNTKKLGQSLNGQLDPILTRMVWANNFLTEL